MRFFLLDVFTDRPFAGNPLAVLPDGRGLDAPTMQRIAAEFGFSETSFVFPEDGAPWRVRIFTPAAEIPFAGHPLVGTAFALVRFGCLEAGTEAPDLRLEVKAGAVTARIRFENGGAVGAEVAAPGSFTLGERADPGEVARLLGLDAGDVVTTAPLPCRAGHGLDFLIVRLADEQALRRAEIRGPIPQSLLARGLDEGIYLFTEGDGTEADILARMFAPSHGIPEDPATGSAAAALAGLLAQQHPEADATLCWRIAQGREMGRPSRIEATARKRAGRLEEVRIGGCCAPLAQGELLL